MKEWISKHLLTACGKKLSGRRINEDWFSKHGYRDQYLEIIKVNEDLNLACKILLGWTSICKRCENIVVLPRIYCCTKCQVNDPDYKEAFKKTMVDRYGVETASHSKTIRDKAKKTMVERHGVEFSWQSNELFQKAKDTMVDRYGVENSGQSEELMQRAKDTWQENWGVDNPMKAKVIQDKARKTNLERYGFEHIAQNPDIQKKMRESTLKKHGFLYALQSETIKEKARQTNLERYGVANPMQSEEVKQRAKQTNIERYGAVSYKRMHYTPELINELSKGLPNITGSTDPLFSCVQSIATVYKMIRDHRPDLVALKGSNEQRDLLQFVKDNTNHVVLENQRVLTGRSEIDIYIPSLKLGFEFNGTFWHSTKFKTKDYHHKKSILAKNLGITLIHLYEFDGLERNKEIILEHLNGTYKPEFKNIDGMLYHNLDRGSLQLNETKFILGEPLFSEDGVVVYGSGFEIQLNS